MAVNVQMTAFSLGPALSWGKEASCSGVVANRSAYWSGVTPLSVFRFAELSCVASMVKLLETGEQENATVSSQAPDFRGMPRVYIPTYRQNRPNSLVRRHRPVGGKDIRID